MLVKKIVDGLRVLSLRRRAKKAIISFGCIVNKNTIVGEHSSICRGSYGNCLIGRYSYIIDGNFERAKIGNFTSIGSDVQVVFATHPTNLVSTYPGFYSSLKSKRIKSFRVDENIKEFLLIDNYSAIIGNDVWIGNNVLIKGGVKIGDGAIIAMGAVVSKDVPPYSIVGGVPAQVIKYRFDKDIVDKLLKIQWWNWSDETLEKNSEYFGNIDEFVKKFLKN